MAIFLIYSGLSDIPEYMPRYGFIGNPVDDINFYEITGMKCPIRKINGNLLTGAPCIPGTARTPHPLDTGM